MIKNGHKTKASKIFAKTLRLLKKNYEEKNINKLKFLPFNIKGKYNEKNLLFSYIKLILLEKKKRD